MANIELTIKTPLTRKIKILVCITPQVNSKRLIDFGFKLADELCAETHILYVQKGSNILLTEKTPSILQMLFDYAAEKNGIIHAECGKNITEAIRDFIMREKITHAIVGEHANNFFNTQCINNEYIEEEDIAENVKRMSPFVEVIILEREK